MILKFILIGIICVFYISPVCCAQVDAVYVSTTNSCNNIELIRYYKVAAGDTVEAGLIIDGKMLRCNIIYKEDKIYIYINGKNSHPSVFFNCNTVQPGHPFNGYAGGKRAGVWFKKYLFGGIRRVQAYNKAGKLYREISLRRNGTVSNMRTWGTYNISAPIKYQSYDKTGTRVGGPKRF